MPLTQLFAKVLNMSLTASLVILLVIAARFVLRKSPKVYAYALWAVVLFRLLCPVSLPSPVSLLGLLNAPTAQTMGGATTVEYIPYRVVETAESNPRFNPVPDAAPAQTPAHAQLLDAEPTKAPLSADKIVAAVWLAGMVAMAGAGLGSYVRFRKQLTGAMRIRDNLYLADHIDSAFVSGLICPKIYLPSDIPLNRMGYIIAHEQHHIRRKDPVVKHLSFAALCVHWFNPLVWLAFILSGRDMEMSCDEAVIRQLGEEIRADYSASLLSLATGRRIIAGTPLAFGEGDTKGRIQNMANWKKPSKWLRVVSLALCIAVFTACAPNPTTPVVVSKNDGSLDIANIQSATRPEAQGTAQKQALQYSDHFQSTDGSVDITLELDQELATENLPMVEVEPRYLTGSDAKRVAQVIFGTDAEFYEQRPVLSDKEILSKAEIAAKLEKWQTWLDMDYMTELYGDAEAAQQDIDLVKLFIADYTERYASAPEADPRTSCQWTMKTDSVYTYDETQLETWDTSEDNMAVQAEVDMDGIPYRFSASVRDGTDFQVNNIHATITDGGMGPSNIGYDEWIARLTRTEKPDESQIAAIQAKAEMWLAQMELGDWAVDQCYLETHTYHGTPEHYVIVKAVPVLAGAAAIRQPGINTPRSNSEYASHYYMTDATFRFAPGGELIDMGITSTIDVTQVVQQAVATLSIEELLEQAKTQLSLTEASSFFWPQEMLELYEEDSGEEIYCAVTVSRASYGLVRIKVPDSDDHYYYVPALMLMGDAEYRGRDTGTVYERYSEMSSQPYYFLCVNAINGSNIPLGE